MADPFTWMWYPGWTTAHLVQPSGSWTMCARTLHSDLEPAPEGVRRCGQCERRKPK